VFAKAGGSVWLRDEKDPRCIRVRFTLKHIVEIGSTLGQIYYRETTVFPSIEARDGILSDMYRGLYEDEYRKLGKPYIPEEEKKIDDHPRSEHHQ
jgi:hypothetical protein